MVKPFENKAFDLLKSDVSARKSDWDPQKPGIILLLVHKLVQKERATKPETPDSETPNPTNKLFQQTLIMATIEQLEPANKADVLVYMPYYAKDKHSILPYAIALYRVGSLEGNRRIESSKGIPFVASWYVSQLPSELTRCRLQFEGQADLSYEMTIINAELIEYLIDAIKTFKHLGSADFSQGFYRKLLRFEE